MQIPFTEHPCLPAVTEPEILAIVERHGARAPEIFEAIERRRVETIAKAAADPLRDGWILEPWRDALKQLEGDLNLLALFGGNGAGKTFFAVWEAICTIFQVPGARVLFLHESEQSSIDVHQSIVYHYLPPELKPRDGWRPKKTVTTQISYDSKNGFTGNSISFPNGSKAVFGFYNQKVKLYEGGGWTRVVADEDMPLNWLDTLLFRLPRSKGKMLWCFTPIDGITPAIKSVTTGAVTLQSRPVDPDLLPPTHRVDELQDWPLGEMPYIQESTREKTRIMYFHSSMNPLSGYEAAKAIGRGKDSITKERRYYGWARNTQRSCFPGFCASHILTAEKMAERLTKPCTHYLVLDPAGARNFYLLWFAVDASGTHYFHREWPDVVNYGEWALPSDDRGKWDGKAGPAQIKVGFGIEQYKKLILEAEGWRRIDGNWVSHNGAPGKPIPATPIWQRFIDPRSGVIEAAADDAGESSLIYRFAEEQLDEAGRISGPSMQFEPAYSGKNEDDGLTQIDQMLTFDRTQPLTAMLNEPKIYVSAECGSLIWAMQNYTAHDGPKAASKDPIDALRYAILKKCMHVHSELLAGFSGGGY